VVILRLTDPVIVIRLTKDRDNTWLRNNKTAAETD